MLRFMVRRARSPPMDPGQWVVIIISRDEYFLATAAEERKEGRKGKGVIIPSANSKRNGAERCSS